MVRVPSMSVSTPRTLRSAVLESLFRDCMAGHCNRGSAAKFVYCTAKSREPAILVNLLICLRRCDGRNMPLSQKNHMLSDFQPIATDRPKESLDVRIPYRAQTRRAGRPDRGRQRARRR
ncbi:hypothetical protein CBM2615_A240265 [Cupriavidus taiwanensis]|nr:hypothetical protein CBM2615_A240265 [Cupriavidus taiwanensis]SOZ54116.1 hypothetical protein CBM2614_A210266 [Cupriavidus taiwanensis]